MRRFKHIMLICLLSFAAASVRANDMDFWDEHLEVDKEAKNQQRTVTDQEFEKVMEHFEKKKNKKEEKNKPKGSPIGPQYSEGQSVPDSDSFKITYESYPTVMVPVTLIVYGQNDIQPGYYRILSVHKDGQYYLNFYQGNTLVAKVPAINTGNDHNQKSLNYAKLVPVNEQYMDVIYGDIDCNIEARLDIRQ